MTCGDKFNKNCPTGGSKVDPTEVDGRARCIHDYCHLPLQGDGTCSAGHSQTMREAEVYVAFRGRAGEEPYTVEVPIELDDAAAREYAHQQVQRQIEEGGMWEQVERLEVDTLETITPAADAQAAAPLSVPPKDRATADRLWAQLGDVPVTEEGAIDAPFLHFAVGTDREDIWHWFEQHFGLSVVDDLGMGKRASREETLPVPPTALPARVQDELGRALGSWVDFHEAARSAYVGDDDWRDAMLLVRQSQELLADPQVAGHAGGRHLRRLLMFYEEFRDSTLEDSAWLDWDEEAEAALATAQVLRDAPSAEEVAAAQGYELATPPEIYLRVYHDYIRGGAVLSEYHYTVYDPAQDRMVSFDVRDLAKDHPPVEERPGAWLTCSRWRDHVPIIRQAVAGLGSTGFAAWLRERGKTPLRETDPPSPSPSPHPERTPQEWSDLAGQLWQQAPQQRYLSTWYPAIWSVEGNEAGLPVEVMLTYGKGRNRNQSYLHVRRHLVRIIHEPGEPGQPDRRREWGTTKVEIVINRTTGEVKEAR